MTSNKSSILRRWAATGQICLALSTFVLLVLGSPEVRAFSQLPDEAQLRRFDELRAIDILICQFRASAIKYEGLDQNDPRISIIQDTQKRPHSVELFSDHGIMFDKENTKAFYFNPSPPAEDLDVAGIEPWTSPVTLLSPTGDSLFVSNTNGSIVLPGATDLFDVEGKFGSIRILANPAYEDIFPVIGGTFAGVEDAWLIAGQCKAGVPDTSSWPRAVWLREATCGESWAQLSVGADQLLRSKTGEGDIVEAYKWFQIYLGAVPETSLGYYIASMERDIAASWMTPEQVAEAERLAAEWVAEPAGCENELQSGAPESATE